MNKFISFIISFSVLVSILSVGGVALAQDMIVVSGKSFHKAFSVYENDITDVLKKALNSCSSATDNDVYTIKLPKGEFLISSNLFLKSNIIIDMTAGTTLTLSAPTGINIFKNKREKPKYKDLVNVHFKGGCFKYSNDFNSSSCLIRLSHSCNIYFDRVSFYSNGNAHCVEIAACRNVVFSQCSFTGTKDNAAKSGEALQIDILDPNIHFANMGPYDYTMNDNITVQYCSFKNLRRGLGTNSLFAGLYQTNVKVISNEFDNISEGAICFSNYVKSQIINNRITNSGWGIKYQMMKPDGYLDSVCIADKKTKICTNSELLIKGNYISVVPTAEVEIPIAIQLLGNNVNYNKSLLGDYFVGGACVESNFIVTNGSAIRLYDTKNSIINDNKIYSSNPNVQGIYLSNDSINNTFASNVTYLKR